MSNIGFTEKNPKLFYDTNDFDFLNPIKDNFSLIKSELLDFISHEN